MNNSGASKRATPLSVLPLPVGHGDVLSGLPHTWHKGHTFSTPS
jgi:hypothetical protein